MPPPSRPLLFCHFICYVCTYSVVYTPQNKLTSQPEKKSTIYVFIRTQNWNRKRIFYIPKSELLPPIINNNNDCDFFNNFFFFFTSVSRARCLQIDVRYNKCSLRPSRVSGNDDVHHTTTCYITRAHIRYSMCGVNYRCRPPRGILGIPERFKSEIIDKRTSVKSTRSRPRNAVFRRRHAGKREKNHTKHPHRSHYCHHRSITRTRRLGPNRRTNRWQ